MTWRPAESPVKICEVDQGLIQFPQPFKIPSSRTMSGDVRRSQVIRFHERVCCVWGWVFFVKHITKLYPNQSDTHEAACTHNAGCSLLPIPQRHCSIMSYFVCFVHAASPGQSQDQIGGVLPKRTLDQTCCNCMIPPASCPVQGPSTHPLRDSEWWLFCGLDVQRPGFEGGINSQVNASDGTLEE